MANLSDFVDRLRDSGVLFFIVCNVFGVAEGIPRLLVTTQAGTIYLSGGEGKREIHKQPAFFQGCKVSLQHLYRSRPEGTNGCTHHPDALTVASASKGKGSAAQFRFLSGLAFHVVGLMHGARTIARKTNPLHHWGMEMWCRMASLKVQSARIPPD